MLLADPDSPLGWSVRGVPLLLAVGIFAEFVLHYGFGLAWRELGVPLLVLLAIQIIAFVAMFWGRRCLKSGNARPGLLILWIYILLFCATAFHYAVRWGLVDLEKHRSDYWQFPLTFSVVMGLAVLFYPYVRKL
jgi:uncharacterized membrane protein YsdA (DUF1294 family)